MYESRTNPELSRPWAPSASYVILSLKLIATFVASPILNEGHNLRPLTTIPVRSSVEEAGRIQSLVAPQAGPVTGHQGARVD